MKSKKLKNISFWGSSNFSLKVLNEIIDDFNIVFVVLKNRKGDFFDFCKSRNLKIFSYDEMEDIDFSSIEFCLVASFGAIISKSILERSNFLNVHPSYLPFYRGATPIQSTLLNGDRESGITVIKMNEKLDKGDIILQKKVEIKDDYNYDKLETIMAKESRELINKSIYMFNKIVPQKQDSSIATYCYVSDFFRDKVKIDFEKNANEVVNLIKASYPAWFYMNDHTIINIKEAMVSDIKSKDGLQILPSEKDLYIACKDFYIKVNLIQKEGRKYQSGRDFKNGLSNIKDLHFF